MASSPIQSILKIEDLTSEDEACKATKEVLYEECLIDDEDDDDPMLSMQNTSTEDTPSTSCSYKQQEQGSQNKIASEDIKSSENRDVKNSVKTKPSQFEAMATFMIAHPDISKGIIKNPELRIKSNDMWNELSDILNKNGPPRRSGEGWRKVWSDHKSHIRNKLRKNKIYNTEPRGWPKKKFYPLSKIETKVAHLLGYVPDEAGGDVTSTLSSAVTETQAPLTLNSSIVYEPISHVADQSDDINIPHDFDESSLPSDRYSPPLSRKCKKELLKSQIENQREYTKHSKKILLEINDSLKGILKYSIKTFELKQKRFELEKEKFIFRQNIEAQKHQTQLEKLQLQRDILRLKQETAGLIN